MLIRRALTSSTGPIHHRIRRVVGIRRAQMSNVFLWAHIVVGSMTGTHYAMVGAGSMTSRFPSALTTLTMVWKLGFVLFVEAFIEALAADPGFLGDLVYAARFGYVANGSLQRLRVTGFRSGVEICGGIFLALDVLAGIKVANSPLFLLDK